MEQWPEARIEAYKRYIKNEESGLKRWKRWRKEAIENLASAERTVEHHESEIKLLKKALEKQEELKQNKRG